MTKKELVNTVAKSTKITGKHTKQFIETFLDSISKQQEGSTPSEVPFFEAHSQWLLIFIENSALPCSHHVRSLARDKIQWEELKFLVRYFIALLVPLTINTRYQSLHYNAIPKQ